MPPRTQAALLEAMEERQATIFGVSYPLPPYFTVFATQNPIEFEGTYPLPEAQLDSFLLKISVGYPDLASEVKILNQRHGRRDPNNTGDLGLISLDSEALGLARQSVINVTIEPALTEYVARLVRKTRDWTAIRLGASPRAAITVLPSVRGLRRHGRPRLSHS
jgi:MoxR-like ATPase